LPVLISSVEAGAVASMLAEPRRRIGRIFPTAHDPSKALHLRL
jgi:hypothetical protein